MATKVDTTTFLDQNQIASLPQTQRLSRTGLVQALKKIDMDLGLPRFRTADARAVWTRNLYSRETLLLLIANLELMASGLNRKIRLRIVEMMARDLTQNPPELNDYFVFKVASLPDELRKNFDGYLMTLAARSEHPELILIRKSADCIKAETPDPIDSLSQLHALYSLPETSKWLDNFCEESGLSRVKFLSEVTDLSEILAHAS